MKKVVISLGVTAIALAAAACGSSPSPTSTPKSTAPIQASGALVKVAIKNFTFIPSKLSLKGASVVEVTNLDSVIHTFTAVNKSFNSGPIMPGQSVMVKIPSGGGTQAVTIAYQCSIHQYMTGTITVTP